MFDRILKKITISHIKLVLIIILSLSLFLVVNYYLNEKFTLGDLIFWTIILLIEGLVFILGFKVAQKDGFVNGFKNGVDGLKKN